VVLEEFELLATLIICLIEVAANKEATEPRVISGKVEVVS
jgi:hypothetical protein